MKIEPVNDVLTVDMIRRAKEQLCSRAIQSVHEYGYEYYHFTIPIQNVIRLYKKIKRMYRMAKISGSRNERKQLKQALRQFKQIIKG